VAYHLNVYPACAGIHLLKKRLGAEFEGLPRMRGDPPILGVLAYQLAESTPHARGSTSLRIPLETFWRVYPACAGIHPEDSKWFESDVSLPRMRGDPPQKTASINLGIMSTPHARGSTL